MNPEFPTGTVTFLFTDLEGSTHHWETHPQAMQAALARHDELVRLAVAAHHGIVVKSTGDGLHAVFSSPSQAVAAACKAQTSLIQEPWAETGPLRVRMSLHTGEGLLRQGDYYGTAVNRAARLMGIGHGGQILLSQSTATLVLDNLPPGSALIDLGEHALRDLVRPEHVYQLNFPGAADRYPPLNSLSSYPNNLPLQLSSFVGRETELEEIKRLFGTTRLLTLTGIGGTGKTRLMLQVAADVLHEYSDGVWLVELAALSDPDLVAGQIARVLGVQEQPDRPLLETLNNFFRLKQLLLLLDNCEHLLEACAKISKELLQSSPGLKILATSREALGISGEIIFQVRSLSLPAAQGEMKPGELMQSEAVQLFVERARAALPAFRLTEQNAPAVVQICRRLDGIPLALELAAARVKALSVEGIATRLDDRFRLLTGGSRSALPRQQTLEALIDWSWNLLTESEQRLLRRLGVFGGGWTLEAADAVALNPGRTDGLDVFEDLTQLVDKSMVAVDFLAEEGARYHLIETIRQYARLKLMEAGESEAVRDRHARYYIDFVIQTEPELKGTQMLVWLKQMKIEDGNIKAAMAWSLEEIPELALHLAGSLWMSLMISGRFVAMDDIYTWLEGTIKKGEELIVEGEEAIRLYQADMAGALCAKAGTKLYRGDYLEGYALAEQSIELARRSGADAILAYALGNKGIAARFLNRDDIAIASANESLRVVRELDDAWELGINLTLGTAVMGLAGHTEQSQLFQDELGEMVKSTGNLLLLARYTLGSGYIALNKGEPENAIVDFNEAARLFEELGYPQFVNMARSEASHILRIGGDIEGAISGYRETIVGWQELENQSAVAHQLECFGYVAIALEELPRAARLMGAAVALRKKFNSARLPNEQGEFDLAIEQLKTRMGETSFNDAFNEGQLMTMEAAIRFALG